jgi:hypothetical protein
MGKKGKEVHKIKVKKKNKNIWEGKNLRKFSNKQ